MAELKCPRGFLSHVICNCQPVTVQERMASILKRQAADQSRALRPTRPAGEA